MAGVQARVLDAPAEQAPTYGWAHRWKQIVRPVEPFLARVTEGLADQVQAFEPEMAVYARHVLAHQGKQLRSALVALSGAAFGRPTKDWVTVAVIVEMIHLATLVHDDVLDVAELRRGRPTLAAKWGNEIAVLLGDCLFAQAVRLAASFPNTDVCRAVATATKRICSGEILQTHGRRRIPSDRAEYFQVLEMKTGELFALSCELGARLGGAPSAGQAALRKYGLALGTSYQIYDDCVDLFGTEAMAGKRLGNDLANGKLTLPVLIALERSSEQDRVALQEMIQEWKPEHLALIQPILLHYDALNESRRVIQALLAEGRSAVGQLTSAQADNTALLALTEFLAQLTGQLGVCS